MSRASRAVRDRIRERAEPVDPPDPRDWLHEGGDAATWWNGEKTPGRRVIVTVGTAPTPAHWARMLVGQERPAVEITYNDAVFYLDDEGGQGWHKATVGRGSPRFGHRELPVFRVVGEVPTSAPCRCKVGA